MKTLNIKGKKIFFFLIIVIIIGGAIITMFLYRRNKYKDLCAYTDKLLEIEWNDCIESTAGDVELDEGEEYARIRLKIKAGSEEEALSIVQNRFVKPLDFSGINDHIVLNYQHEFATELENSDIQYVFETVTRGKRRRTRAIRVYVVYDENRRMYIYVMD